MFLRTFRWFVSIVLLAVAWTAWYAPVSHVLAQQADLPELEEQALKGAVARVAPSVVRVETFGGLEQVGQTLISTGPATGLVVAADGYVISSAYNFVQKPASILVTLASGKRSAAEIVARDHSRMLVLLKVNTPEKLPVPQAVPREDLLVGQWTLAVGRAYDQPEPNVSVGILSATNRVWGKAIQTDAKISPSNYGGPLIDIRGRVLGVLVPLSPQGQIELAGSELYDSGIGFAVPLTEINAHLERMKQGHDLHPGLMGISLKGTDVLSDPALIAACSPKSPAALAGLKAGDTIVDVNGAAIERQSQLKHALGRHYAGDAVKVVVLRGGQRIAVTLELAEKILPYQHPFLGVLPQRDAADAGVTVRYVYPSSGADQAGLRAGDRIVSLGDKPVADATTLRDAIAAFDPGAKVAVGVQRGGESLRLEVTTATLPTQIPEALPAARRPLEGAGGDKPAVGVVPIKLPEDTHECVAYVPENYDPRVGYGVVVWLHPPGGFKQDELVARWKPLCERHDLILLAPKSADATKWLPTEIPFIRKTIDDLASRYQIDRTRIVTHGFQAGGALAYLVAFGHRDLIRGVAAVDAPPPLRSQAPENDPIQRLAIYTTFAEKSKLAKAITAGVDKLKELKFPVTVKTLPDARYLNDEELTELVRWLDTLDRI